MSEHHTLNGRDRWPNTETPKQSLQIITTFVCIATQYAPKKMTVHKYDMRNEQMMQMRENCSACPESLGAGKELTLKIRLAASNHFQSIKCWLWLSMPA